MRAAGKIVIWVSESSNVGSARMNAAIHSCGSRGGCVAPPASTSCGCTLIRQLEDRLQSCAAWTDQ